MAEGEGPGEQEAILMMGLALRQWMKSWQPRACGRPHPKELLLFQVKNCPTVSYSHWPFACCLWRPAYSSP